MTEVPTLQEYLLQAPVAKSGYMSGSYDDYVDTVDCNDDDTHVSSDDAGTTWFRVDIFGISLSLISLIFVSFAILADKRVRSHPNSIIAMICLCDAYTYSQFLQRYFYCGFLLNIKMERLFSWTVVEPYWWFAL